MSEIITRNELQLIEPAMEPTRTFHPVPHIDIANLMLNLGNDILKGYDLYSETYQVARNNAQCFATITYSRGDDSMNFSIGWRNSTDKSLAIGICLGAQIIVCSNLMFDGEIKILRKHSKGVWDAIETLAITSFYKHTHSYDRMIEDAGRLRAMLVNDEQVARWLGLLFYRGIVSPRQLPVALKEWQNPQFPEFEPRTAFSAYNAVTHSLKSAPPSNAMEAYTDLHRSIIDI